MISARAGDPRRRAVRGACGCSPRWASEALQRGGSDEVAEWRSRNPQHGNLGGEILHVRVLLSFQQPAFQQFMHT